MSTRKHSWATPANGLTTMRVLLVPPLLIAIGNGRTVTALVLMVAAGASDIADGKLARRTGTASRLGAILDPTADTILVLAAQTALVALGVWPVYLLLLSVGSILTFALASALAGRIAGGTAGKYVGAALTGGIVAHLVCEVIGPEIWPVATRVICPAIGAHLALSMIENIHQTIRVGDDIGNGASVGIGDEP